MDVFMSMPFVPAFDPIWKTIQEATQERALTSYRVDQEHLGEPIADNIERRIRESRIVIADLTGNNPNVLHELGQAQALGKPLILISQDPPEQASFNIRGRYIHKYAPSDTMSLRRILKEALSQATSPNEMLRAMLVPGSLGHPTKDSRFVIAVSPLSYRRVMGRSGGYKRMQRTYSDYVGVRGILQAFGLLYGFETLPDLIDPEDYDDTAMTEPTNLYCIASPKANRWTASLLEQYQQRWVPRIEFRADAASKSLKNVRVLIYSDDALLHPPGWKINAEGDRYCRDFGLVVRGPNPSHEKHMVAIIAGRSSLGTEAASRAFTDPNAVAEIRRRLDGLKIDLEDHKQAFWAVVSMQRSVGDEKEEAIPSTLRVHQVDAFHSVS
jgi:hypothetical protein